VQERGPNTLLEVEETNQKYVYLILRGEIALYKRPESLYDSKGKRIKANNIPLWSNPKDSGHDKIGMKVGVMKGENLIGEDAFLFKQTLAYSIVTETSVLALRYKAAEAMV